MRYLISFLVLFTACPAFADSTPQSQIAALVDYCVPAIEGGIAPADYAAQKKLSEFPPEQAIKFSPEGGRVFAIPTDVGNAVLMTNKDYAGMCGIAVRVTDPEKFWALVHEKFNKATGYRLLHEKRMEAERVTRKDFEKDTLKGPIALLVSVSDRPRDGGMQALMTFARIKEKTKP